MAKKHGKQVHNEFVLAANFLSRTAFHQAVKEKISYLRNTPELYEGNKVGIVKVFHSKRGARIIAYNAPEKP